MRFFCTISGINLAFWYTKVRVIQWLKNIASMNRKQLAHSLSSQLVLENDTYQLIRRHRIMQISMVIAMGLMVSLLVARSITITIFSAGLCCVLLAFLLAYKHKAMASAYVLLSSMAAMLSALALTGAGLYDMAILGFPVLLIFAAILGGVGLFLTTLIFVITLCALIGWLTLQGFITPNSPTTSTAHLLFIMVIFVITGFSVYILVYDIKRLMNSLQRENAKVRRSKSKIEHLAHHDTLTNLPNRLYGEELFTLALNQCLQNNQSLAILFIDLDNFKPVNDALGHAAGDKLLKQLTQKLKDSMAPEQYLIRFGGDEFLVLAPYSGCSEQLDQLAANLIQQSASVFDILQTQVVVSASVGIASSPQDGSDFKQLCRKADIAMYKAKENGRNTYHFYHDSLDQEADDKFKLLQRLRPAIEEQQFQLYYQPIYDLKSLQITSIEALLRWPQANGGMISPAQFIPITESSGLINQLGAWVLEEAFLFCAGQRQKGHTELRVAVNISVVQLKGGKLQTQLENALKLSGLPADAVVLEITESVLIDDADKIQKQLNELSQAGIRIAIDDFGTGYSNLSYLRNFHATKLKIDRSFVQSLGTSDKDEPLVKAIISMASSLGLKTVAEGVEDSVTLQKLAALDCDYGQGFYWSKPLPGDELSELLAAQQSA